jgi:hypothetical protein
MTLQAMHNFIYPLPKTIKNMSAYFLIMTYNFQMLMTNATDVIILKTVLVPLLYNMFILLLINGYGMDNQSAQIDCH